MDSQTLQSHIWSMNAKQLAEQCRILAESHSTAIDETLKAEAGRLYTAWQDVVQRADDSVEDHTRKASLQAGLRKRTIEILIKISQKMGAS